MVVSIAIALLVALYAFACLPMAVVARRTNDQAGNAWMAFIPFVNLILMCRLARKSAHLAWLVLASVVPVLGWFVVVGLQCYLWIHIGRRFQRRWQAYLAAVVPFIGGWVFALSIKREAPLVLDAR